jgi:hypothetical protein
MKMDRSGLQPFVIHCWSGFVITVDPAGSSCTLVRQRVRVVATVAQLQAARYDAPPVTEQKKWRLSPSVYESAMLCDL